MYSLLRTVYKYTVDGQLDPISVLSALLSVSSCEDAENEDVRQGSPESVRKECVRKECPENVPENVPT